MGKTLHTHNTLPTPEYKIMGPDKFTAEG